MRQVELVPGIRSSALGFGCAAILGAVDATTAKLALNTALEEGITHLDIAPSYGYGAAEAWLGRELQARRDQVVLATKFGIAATWQARFFTPFKPLVRALRSNRSGPTTRHTLNKEGRKLGEIFHRRVPITAEGMRLSVERSLSRLRTDYLDYLFLHEPVKSIGDLDTLAAEAESLKAAGKIRGWGLAYQLDQHAIHATYLACFDVLQFNLQTWDYGTVMASRSLKPNVFFSILQSRPANFTPEMILRKIAKDFPNSVVLCSMFNPIHIRQNARAC